MSGSKCPYCGKSTFIKTATGGQCTSCGKIMTTPANDGKGGRGKKCPRCNHYTIFDNVCRSCGARFTDPK